MALRSVSGAFAVAELLVAWCVPAETADCCLAAHATECSGDALWEAWDELLFGVPCDVFEAQLVGRVTVAPDLAISKAREPGASRHKGRWLPDGINREPPAAPSLCRTIHDGTETMVDPHATYLRA